MLFCQITVQELLFFFNKIYTRMIKLKKLTAVVQDMWIIKFHTKECYPNRTKLLCFNHLISDAFSDNRLPRIEDSLVSVAGGPKISQKRSVSSPPDETTVKPSELWERWRTLEVWGSKPPTLVIDGYCHKHSWLCSGLVLKPWWPLNIFLWSSSSFHDNHMNNKSRIFSRFGVSLFHIKPATKSKQPFFLFLFHFHHHFPISPISRVSLTMIDHWNRSFLQTTHQLIHNLWFASDLDRSWSWCSWSESLTSNIHLPSTQKNHIEFHIQTHL